MLRVYSTLSKTKEEFRPRASQVSMYVCGMTPKFHPHLGHARIFLAADIMRRYLEYRGYQVKHVQNFTDVDDKIIARAGQEGASAEEVARRYSDSYFGVMDALGIVRAHEYPTVSGYMPQIIEFIHGLIDKGYGYVSNGDVWYDVSKFDEYGKLSGRLEESGRTGVRVDLEPGKRDPRDFALWKAAKPGEPSWESPWGAGRPGWHIECSAMSRATLGDQIDIHSGGADLIFPHHENEIAQSEALTGKAPFAAYWPHVGLVTTGGEKVSHSLENFTTVEDTLKLYEPMVVRLYLLSTHYRSALLFGEDGLVAATRNLERFRATVAGVTFAEPPPWSAPRARSAQEAFEAAMDDDFNSAAAIGHLFDLSRDINRMREEGDDDSGVLECQGALVYLAGVLGIDLLAAPRVSRDLMESAAFINLLLEVRRSLRAARQFELSDTIRDRLKELGIIVEDATEGSTWRHARPGE
ncbi:MAG: cysteine--tRNA ligase [Chloroflexota bacterium]